MKHIQRGNFYVIRLSKGEEAIEAISRFCKENGISSGCLTAIGASDKIALSLYDTSKKKYYKKEFTGDHEIANISGNITTREGEIHLHLHATIADKRLNSYAGHLASAVISATLEIFLQKIEPPIKRAFDEETGLYLMDI